MRYLLVQVVTAAFFVVYFMLPPFEAFVDQVLTSLLLTATSFWLIVLDIDDGRFNAPVLDLLVWIVWHTARLVRLARGPPAARRPIPGAIGALPVHAWSEVVDWLSGGAPETRRALLELRATSRDLHALVAARGHVGRLRVGPARSDMLEFALVSRAAMGQSLLVEAFVPESESCWCEAPAKRLLWEALRRGHRVSVASDEYLTDIDDVLAEAARENLLVMPRYRRGEVTEQMLQYTELRMDEWRVNLERLKEATSLRRVVLERPAEAIPHLPRSLRELHLVDVSRLGDLSPVAWVPKVVVVGCNYLLRATSMRNHWLEIRGCRRLRLVGLGEHIGRLVLADLPSFEMGCLAVMEDQPPRTLVLEGMQVDEFCERVLARFPHVIRRGSLLVDR